MKTFLNFRVLGLLLVAFVLCTTGAFATDSAITIPSLEIDWAATATAVMTAMKPGVIAAFGIGVAIMIAMAVYRFIRRTAH